MKSLSAVKFSDTQLGIQLEGVLAEQALPKVEEGKGKQ